MERTPHREPIKSSGHEQPIWTAEEHRAWDKFAFSADYRYLNTRQREYLENAPSASADKSGRIELHNDTSSSVEEVTALDPRFVREDSYERHLNKPADKEPSDGVRTREAPGATQEGVDATVLDRKVQNDDEFLAVYGADKESLRNLEPREQIERLVTVATLRVKDRYDDDTEMAKNDAEDRLAELIQEDPTTYISALFEQIDLHKPETIELMKLIGVLRKMITHVVQQENHKPGDRIRASRRLLDPIINEAISRYDDIYAAEDVPYLVQQVTVISLHDLIGKSDEYCFDRIHEPFAITDHQTAVLTEDGDRLYICENTSIESERTRQGSMFDIYDHILDNGQLIENEIGYIQWTDETLDRFVLMHSPVMRGLVQGDFRVSLSHLSIPEQFCLLRYLERVTVQDANTMKEFVMTNSSAALRTFLALDEDASFGDRIIELGTRLEHDTAQKLFEKYGEIIDASEQAQQYAADVLMKEKGTDTDTKAFVADIAKNLRHKANDLLRDAHTSLTNDTVPELLKKLETIRAENLLWAATFREATRTGVPIEAFRDTSLETLSGGELSERKADVEAMRTLLINNYKGYENEAFRNAVLGAFDAHVGDPHTRWYALKHKDTIVGFNRVDEVHDTETGELKELYLGSFNVERMQYGGNGIGNAILKTSLEREASRGAPIRAHCDPRAPITQKYIEWGFVAEKTLDYAGVPSFEIVMDKRRTYRSQTLTTSDIEALSQGEAENGLWVERVAEGVPPFTKLTEGYVLTRYLTQGGQVTAVFEKVQEDYPRPARQ